MKRAVVVTGAASGNGLAIAYEFHIHGWDVIGLDKVKPDDKSIFMDFIHGDLTKVIKNDDPLLLEICSLSDCLVNNAGITLPGASKNHTYQYWRKTLEINLTVPFILSNYFAQANNPSKKKRYIVNIASLAAHQGFPNNPAYHASKGGLLSLTRSQAVDFASLNINVNSISPGYIKTSMTHNSYMNYDLREARSSRAILKRWGEPREVAKAARFLASDDANFITGTDLKVDGGWTSNGF